MKKKISVLMCAILVIGSLAGCAKKEEKKPEPTKKEKVTEEVKKEEEEEVKKEESDGKIIAGTNQSDATPLPLDSKIFAKVKKDSNAWFAFTTGEDENAVYKATIVNMTPEAGNIYGYLFDEYGESLSNTPVYNDGKPASLTSQELMPNTTYYIQLEPNGNKSVDFSLIIKSPDAKDLKAGLVFEKPLEINETQVQFEAEKAKFIDENGAKEVLRPVAEAILEKPESVVLIAGTTATDGEQEARVKLSNERAEAVKNLLVKTYKVPEKQIKTVGLGFEADPFERGKDRDSSGKFVESEGRKNRRVVILDASDEIAQGILNNNK